MAWIPGRLVEVARDLVGAATPEGVRRVERELAERLDKVEVHANEFGYDRYGFHAEEAWPLLLPVALLYHFWFRVEVHDIERVPRGGFLLVANHAGQFGYDGMMLGMAMLLRAEPPRLARGMSDFVFWRLPWVSRLVARMGTVVGTPENCVAMLEDGECVMVFPEGARGANKPFRERYRLQPFGRGFARIALDAEVPVVPVGIVGSEEQQPGLANLEGFGRRLGLPSFPITISQPWFGLAGSAFALPVKYHLYFGEPLQLEGSAYGEDSVVNEQVDRVKVRVRSLIARGLDERKGIFV